MFCMIYKKTLTSIVWYLCCFVCRIRKNKEVSSFSLLAWADSTSIRHGLHNRSSDLLSCGCENELINDPHLSTLTTDAASIMISFISWGGGRKAVCTLWFLLDRHWAFHFRGKPTNQQINHSINQSVNQGTFIYKTLTHIQRRLKALRTIKRQNQQSSMNCDWQEKLASQKKGWADLDTRGRSSALTRWGKEEIQEDRAWQTGQGET